MIQKIPRVTFTDCALVTGFTPGSLTRDGADLSSNADSLFLQTKGLDVAENG